MVSAGHRAYESIRDMILDGQLEEGSPLREEHLAEVLGVSRTPIREAIRRLDAEGLVEFKTHRGALVTSWSPERLDEIFALRSLVEGWGAEGAAHSTTSEDIEALGKLAREMMALAEEGGVANIDRIAALNNEFHRLIATSSGSSYLTDILDPLIHLPLVYRTFHLYSESDLRRSLGHHLELVDAVAARNGPWAAAVMRAHIFAAQHVVQRNHPTDEVPEA